MIRLPLPTTARSVLLMARLATSSFRFPFSPPHIAICHLLPAPQNTSSRKGYQQPRSYPAHGCIFKSWPSAVLGLAACAPTVTLGGDPTSHQLSWAFWLFSQTFLCLRCVFSPLPKGAHSLLASVLSFFLFAFLGDQCVSVLRFCFGHRTYFSYILCLFYSGLLNS